MLMYMWGLRGRKNLTPPSPDSRYVHGVGRMHMSRERMPTATYVLVFRSKGRSVRIPRRMSAAAHL